MDLAQLLTPTAPEMTVLVVVVMRALNANVGQSKTRQRTKQPETLPNDYFVTLFDMNPTWQKASTS